VTRIMYQDCLVIDCVPVFHKIITPAYLLYRSGPVAVYYSEIYSLFYGSGHTATSSLLTLFVSFAGGGAKIIVAPLRPACRAAAAAIGRYLLPAPDLSSRPSSRCCCCCCCRLTGRTDGHYVLCRPRSNHRNNNYIIHSDFITVSVELKFSHNVVNKSLQLL